MLKDFSREGAKKQRNTIRSATCFAPLRLCVKTLLASLLLLNSTSAFSQTKASRFDPDGSFWLHESTPQPSDFSDFGGINLNAKRSRHLPKQGLQTMDGKTYRFKTLTVRQNNFTFTTLAISGISYSFSGKFLKGGVYSSGILDDETPVLEGTLSKFRNGKKLAEAKLKFVYFGGT